VNPAALHDGTVVEDLAQRPADRLAAVNHEQRGVLDQTLGDRS
jgi:hypothetical protein